MAKKRSRKYKKKKRIRFHRSFFLPFLITLTAAVALGVLALAAHQWIMEPVKTKPAEVVRSDHGNETPRTEGVEPVEKEDAARREEEIVGAEPQNVSRY